MKKEKNLPDILVEIIANKRAELRAAKSAVTAAELERRAAQAPAPRDMWAVLRRAAGGPVRIIAEVKRRSPSAGEIAAEATASEVAQQYAAAGADAISVLTDRKFFGGSLDDLAAVRAAVNVPVLRKDFLVDPYQVWEARAAGADAFLLIAEVLEAALLEELVALGRRLGMEALVEAHGPEALDWAVASGAHLLGVNNRDLRTFQVDLGTTERLAARVPADRVLVAESGIAGAEEVRRVLAAGAQAVLVGETLMRAADRAGKIREIQAAQP
jgi:indole-3-glycerol phosphate synthase